MSDQITYKDLNEGDRVKVEIEGVIDSMGDLVDNPEAMSWYVSSDVLSTAKITLLEPELKVGRAEHKSSGRNGRVAHVEDGLAWFRSASDYGNFEGIYPAADLRNIPEDTDNG